ncbi:DUF4241 domain-containing protein [Actinoplanes solisilvae]|uniref:DUF4241 domain-containing protein n=1 Tax=Actinoplanes solisilvae TaxID=2486853 RepID=UPI001F0CAB98|nr:DUF4241 domain-containing protein [Actinoplanes solisilvae]
MPDLDLLLSDPGLERHELGTVHLPTGQVVGCDPLMPSTEPFLDAVEPGRYPLRAWLAVPQRRVAALQLGRRRAGLTYGCRHAVGVGLGAGVTTEPRGNRRG